MNNIFSSRILERLRLIGITKAAHRISPKFPVEADCILSHLGLIRPSWMTNTRSVVETLPCSIIARLGSKSADCPILNIITISEVITLDVFSGFPEKMVVKALRGFPQQGISPLRVIVETSIWCFIASREPSR